MISVDDYVIQKDNIEYKGKIYSVRDNGAVLRHSKSAKVGQYDNVWTFGKQDTAGYMAIAGERIHRIVAIAFLGNPPTSQHVVDHIDTNRANNRPENLRWVTRLENTLLNPITAKKIMLICGSIENFLNDPHKYFDKLTDQNIAWMRTVSNEEATNCLEHLSQWAKSDIDEEYDYDKSKGLGEWIFTRKQKSIIKPLNNIINFEGEKFYESPTQHCLQNWYSPTEFVRAPKTIGENPLLDYYNNLKKDEVFSKNKYSVNVIKKVVLCDNFIAVMCINPAEDAIKPFVLAKILYRDGVFYHYNENSYFYEDGAEKYFTLLQGLEWTGGEVFDDLC